ncbi:hypothetical protein EHM82_03000, partial [bacterium]
MKGDGSDLVLELANGRLIRLGSNHSPVSRRDLLAEGKRKGESLERIFWWDLAGGDVLLFGDVHRPEALPDQQWKSGFFRVPLNSPKAFQSLYEIETGDPARIFYRAVPLLTALGDTSYMLLMEEKPRIVRSRKGSAGLETLRAFPAELAQRPVLPPWKQLDDYAPLMLAVERSTMPVALLGWEGSLFVLG